MQGLDPSYFTTHNDMLNAVTLEQINELAS